MTKIGRNSPCPCGSGRKYKACCLAAANASDFQFRLNRRLYSEVIPWLIEFATDSPEFIEAAWIDFNGTDDVEMLDPEGPMSQLFMPWFLFNWAPELEGQSTSKFFPVSIAQLFLFAHRNELTSDHKDFLLSSVRCPYTLCEAIDVKPGVGMTIFDLLRRIQFEVVERTASQIVKKGEIIYCATSELRGFRSNIGTGPYPLRPTANLDVLELRKWMLNEAGTKRITSKHLLEFEGDIRWLYLDLVAERLAPPVLVNTDGHRMMPQKLYFDIDSAHAAFHALKFLAEVEDENDLLKEAVVENGVIKKVEFQWLGDTKKAKKRLGGGSVLLGSLTIERQKLVIDVNSTERADMIREIVEQRLAGHAAYIRTMIEPIESQVREMWQSAADSGGSPTSNSSSQTKQSGIPSLDEAEIREIMAETAGQYWKSWFDDPIPALNNMTPLEAAKTEEGRDLLESLLLEYENHGSVAEDVLRPNITALRRKLGMDQKPGRSHHERES